MKHLLTYLCSLYLRMQVWGQYKRTRREAWGARKKEMVQSKVKVLSSVCSSDSTHPLLIKIALSGTIPAGYVIETTYGRLNDEANKLRTIYFLLRGKPWLA